MVDWLLFISNFTLTVGILSDVLTTYYFTNYTELPEANPLMDYLLKRGLFYPIQIFLLLFALYVNLKNKWWLIFLLLGLYRLILGGLRNLWLIIKYRKETKE